MVSEYVLCCHGNKYYALIDASTTCTCILKKKKTPSKHTTNNKKQSIWHHGTSCLEFETDRARVPLNLSQP